MPLSDIKGFSSVSKLNATMLILGSMPGKVSLENQQYYAHPRNSFWPILARLFAFDLSANYSRRLAYLTQSQVALWDVLQACRRSSSLDADISVDSIQTNDFLSFLERHSSIRHIYFNGAKAEQLFRRYVLPSLTTKMQTIPCLRLPSTSPAYAAMNFEKKLIAWQAIINNRAMLS